MNSGCETYLVSAIITTHNRLDLLPRAIDSVINQTYKNLECIVVDDASSDGTLEYCQSRSDIVYIRISPEDSKGGNHARNTGIKAAKGRYVAFLDDDDSWMTDKIRLQMELVNRKQAKFVYCGRRIESVKSGNVTFKNDYPLQEFCGDMSGKILESICCVTSTILVDKRILQQVGCFDESLRFWQEYELTIRLAQVIPFYFVNDILIVYRVNPHDKNRRTNKYDEWIESVKYIHQKHKALYEKADFVSKMRSEGLVYVDAFHRAKASNLKYRASLNFLLSFIYLLIPRILKIPKYWNRFVK